MRLRIATGLALGLAAALALPAAAQDVQRRRGFEVAIAEPANQQVVFGNTKIAAEVKISDPALIERVEFIIDDKVIFVDREAPWECFFDFGDESRSWVVRVVAHHVEDLTVSDAVITRKMNWAAIERVNRVLLWVSATDKDDEFVTDLAKGEFTVQEDGKPQQVLDFYHEDRPISMAILIDTSGSMLDKIKEVHKAAGAFVETLRAEDRALVIDFDDNVFLIQDLTSDHALLQEAITSTEPIGATSLYDALHAAYRKIGTFDGRKAIVVLSDGEDTTSQFSFQRVLEEAKLNSALIYSIAIGGALGGGRRDVLREFSETTGGRFYRVNKADELGPVYERIAEELRKQYYLSYSTTNETWDGRWIKLDVESDRPGVKIRARRGYYAVPSKVE